jgi:CRP-like cAMP-binding protein
MADELYVDLVVAKSRLEYVDRNGWVLILDKARHLNFQRDDTLIQRGTQPKMVFMVVEGRARVSHGLGGTIGQIGPGEICGEMAFLENARASASVIAAEAMVVYGVTWPVLQNLFELYPRLASRFYRSLAVGLSRRLRDQISRVSEGDPRATFKEFS